MQTNSELPGSDFLSQAGELLGPRGLTSDAEQIAPWLTDWRGRFTGRALALALSTPENLARQKHAGQCRGHTKCAKTPCNRRKKLRPKAHSGQG